MIGAGTRCSKLAGAAAPSTIRALILIARPNIIRIRFDQNKLFSHKFPFSSKIKSEDLKEVTKARKEQDVNLLVQLGVGWLLNTYYLDLDKYKLHQSVWINWMCVNKREIKNLVHEWIFISTWIGKEFNECIQLDFICRYYSRFYGNSLKLQLQGGQKLLWRRNEAVKRSKIIDTKILF